MNMLPRLCAALLLGLAGTAAADPPTRPDLPVPAVRKPSKINIAHVEEAVTSNAVPRGSYLQSCGPVSVSGDVLSGTCRNSVNATRETSISVSRCAGVDIYNNEGTLECVSPVRANWGGKVLPPGSWRNSCIRAVVNGTTLEADCHTGQSRKSEIAFGIGPSSEGLQATRIDLARCPDGADVANISGNLTCVN